MDDFRKHPAGAVFGIVYVVCTLDLGWQIIGLPPAILFSLVIVAAIAVGFLEGGRYVVAAILGYVVGSIGALYLTGFVLNSVESIPTVFLLVISLVGAIPGIGVYHALKAIQDKQSPPPKRFLSREEEAARLQQVERDRADVQEMLTGVAVQQGPSILMNCPACEKRNIQASVEESTQQNFAGQFIAALRFRATWVKCSACGNRMRSLLPMHEMRGKSPVELQSFIRYRARTAVLILGIAGLVVCFIPLLGLSLSAAALYIGRGTGGLARPIAIGGVTLGGGITLVLGLIFVVDILDGNPLPSLASGGPRTEAHDGRHEPARAAQPARGVEEFPDPRQVERFPRPQDPAKRDELGPHRKNKTDFDSNEAHQAHPPVTPEVDPAEPLAHDSPVSGEHLAEIAAPSRESPQDPTPADGTPSADNEYENRLNDLKSDRGFDRKNALEWLAAADPGKLESKDLRKQIARAFRDIAMDEEASVFDRQAAIPGLVTWGGKYSTPVLISLLQTQQTFVRRDVYQALAKLGDERAIEPVVQKMASEALDAKAAMECLASFGTRAEDAVLPLLLTKDMHTFRQTLKLLGHVGTEKTLQRFLELRRSRHYGLFRRDIEDAASAIRKREK